MSRAKANNGSGHLFLSPYSLELKGIENLWHDLRRHCWSNRSYDDCDELFDVASTTWHKHGRNSDLITSVCVKTHIPTRS